MASTESLDELLANPQFMASVDGVYKALVHAQRDAQGQGTIRVAVALDALSFVTATLLEADPAYAENEGLATAIRNIAEDEATMLRFLRDHHDATGHHMLEGMHRKLEGPAPPRVARPGDQRPEDPLHRLVHAIQTTLLAPSDADDLTLDRSGQLDGYLQYDLPTIIAALTHLLGAVAAQSRAYGTSKEQRQLADAVRQQFLTAFGRAEQVILRLRD